MDHCIDGERQPEFHHRSGESQFTGVRTGIVGDTIRARCIHVLQRKLDMVQSYLLQLREARRVNPDRRGDQIGVEPAACAAAVISTRSRRDAGSPPDRCTCSTPSAAASRNTRAQVAVSSSSARLSSAKGLSDPDSRTGSDASTRQAAQAAREGLAAAALCSRGQHPLSDQFHQQVGDITCNHRAVGSVQSGEFVDNLRDRPRAVAAAQDFAGRSFCFDDPLWA